ncbi:MAG TPA: hypothetical protein DEP72_00910 [Clostridiales bacterium]|nr:MAG: hypothetical protein A2Y18_05005 [Clostridiales bacterium GWD2_32_19]HCC06713.1 hypothetical protein [Clostridiales bacterium]
MNSLNLNVFWKDLSGYIHKIAKMGIKGSKFEFLYDQFGANEARESGFNCVSTFPDIDKVYFGDEFPEFFNSRIPSRSRSDVFNGLGIPVNDIEEYIKETGAKLATDNISFGIIEDETEEETVV